MADRPAPGASADTVSADLIANRGFSVSRRGFDQDEVKEFLQLVAGAVRSLHDRVAGLEASLADAEHRAANPHLDEDTLLGLVGEETGVILRSARAAATEMSANAERAAVELRASVEAETAALREVAERETTELRETAAQETTALREAAERDTTELREITARETTELREAAERETAALREDAERDTAELRASAEAHAAQVRETADHDVTALRDAATRETTELRETTERETTELRSRAEAEAARVVDEARQSAGDLRNDAESVLARKTEEADQAVARIEAAAKENAEQVLERARRDAEALRQQAEQERRLTVEGAQGVREKILGDLTRRRRVASTQIEQLRAGRERLLASYAVVRRTLEEVNDDLHRADAEAREAAAEAGRAYESGLDDDELVPDLLHDPVPDAAGEADGDASESVVEDSVVEDPVVEDSLVEESGVDGGDVDGSRAGPESVGPDVAVEPVVVEPVAVEAVVAEAAVVEAAVVAAEPVVPEVAADAEPVAVLEEVPVASEPEAPEDVPAAPAARPASPRRRGRKEAPAAVPAASTSSTPAETSEPKPGVDDLFARLRAGRQDAVAHAHEVLDDEPAVEGPAAEELADPPAPPSPRRGRRGSGSVAVAEAPAVEPVASEPRVVAEAVLAEAVLAEPVTSGSTASVGAEDDLEPRHSDEEESWLQQRDRALSDTETALTRKLKRAIQDEQNDLLDRLRSLRGKPTVDSLLLAPDAQQVRFSRAASVLVEQGGRLGASFAVDVLAASGRMVVIPAQPAPVAELAEELAAALVTPLRHRLEQTIAENGDDDQTVLVEALGGAYREWKTQRIERLAGDTLAAAFARGVLQVTPDDVALRWVADDLDGPCSDCDDNVLAGPQPKGEEYPTGQVQPPAHAGCRCILVPAP